MKSISIENYTLRIGVSPWLMMNPECFGNDECYSGYELEVLELVIAMINVSTTLVYSHENGCGNVINGTDQWSALCGMLSRDEIDMTGNVCALEQARVEAFGYSWPVWMDAQTFWLKAPVVQAESFNPAAPFSAASWIALGAVITCAIGVLSAYYFAGLDNKSSHYVTRASHEFAGSCCFLSRPSRTLFWICGLFFLAAVKLAYVTYIRAAMLYPRPVYAPFVNIDQLAAKLYTGEYKLLHYHRDPSQIVPRAPPITEEVILQAILNHGYYHVNRTDTALFDALLEHPNAVLVKSSTFTDAIVMEFSDRGKLWRIEDQLVSNSPLSYLWKKDFPLSRQINQALLKLGMGKQEMLIRKVGYAMKQIRTTPVIYPEVNTNADTMKLHQVLGPLLYLMLCMLIASLMVPLEKFWIKRVLRTNQWLNKARQMWFKRSIAHRD